MGDQGVDQLAALRTACRVIGDVRAFADRELARDELLEDIYARAVHAALNVVCLIYDCFQLIPAKQIEAHHASPDYAIGRACQRMCASEMST